MKQLTSRLRTYALWLALGALTVLMWSSTVAAQGNYTLYWWTLEPGGSSSGDGYEVTGVAGQMDAGVLSGGNFTLSGGFILSEEVAPAELFLPAIEGRE